MTEEAKNMLGDLQALRELKKEMEQFHRGEKKFFHAYIWIHSYEPDEAVDIPDYDAEIPAATKEEAEKLIQAVYNPVYFTFHD